MTGKGGLAGVVKNPGSIDGSSATFMLERLRHAPGGEGEWRDAKGEYKSAPSEQVVSPAPLMSFGACVAPLGLVLLLYVPRTSYVPPRELIA